MRWWILLCALTTVALPASAQEPAPEPPAEPTQGLAPETAPRPAPVPRAASNSDEAAYKRGFAALMAGRFEAAIVAFDQVLATARNPERRAAAKELGRLARQLMRKNISYRVVSDNERENSLLAPDDRPDAGRTGFIVLTTLASAYGGIVLNNALDADNVSLSALVISGSTALGFAGSLIATRRHNMTQGMADAWGFGLVLGLGNGLLLAEPGGLLNAEQALPFTFGTMLAGGITALVVADYARPTPAQVTFVQTIGGLGIATVGFGIALAQPEVDDPTAILLSLTAGLDVGTGIGVVLAPRVRWSKARARLVQTGAALGALAAGSLALIFTGDPQSDNEVRAVVGAGLIGVWSGAATATYLTRDMRVHARFRSRGTSTALMPARIGSGYGFTLSGQLR